MSRPPAVVVEEARYSDISADIDDEEDQEAYDLSAVLPATPPHGAQRHAELRDSPQVTYSAGQCALRRSIDSVVLRRSLASLRTGQANVDGESEGSDPALPEAGYEGKQGHDDAEHIPTHRKAIEHMKEVLLSPYADESLLERRSILHWYDDSLVETIYMEHRSERRKDVSVAALVNGISFLINGITRLNEGGVFGILLLACAISTLLIGLFNLIYNVIRPRSVRVYELCGFLLLVPLIIYLPSVYGILDECAVREANGGLDYETAKTYCVTSNYVFITFIQAYPLYFIEVRPMLAVPLVILTPIAFLLGRLAEAPDTTAELGSKIGFHFVGTAIVVWMMYVTSLSKRARFEAWVQLQRNTKKAEVKRQYVDDALTALLPSATLVKLQEGTAPFDCSSRATVGVCHVHDYHQWSTTITSSILVETLDALFCRFDDKTSETPGMRKAKTVGDSYVVSMGLHRHYTCKSDRTLIRLAALNALQVVDFSLFQVKAVRLLHRSQLSDIQISVGVHTGFCAGGIVGTTSLWYEVFGEAFDGALGLSKSAHPMIAVASESTVEVCGNGLEIEGDAEHTMLDNAGEEGSKNSLYGAEIYAGLEGKARHLRGFAVIKIRKEKDTSLLKVAKQVEIDQRDHLPASSSGDADSSLNDDEVDRFSSSSFVISSDDAGVSQADRRYRILRSRVDFGIFRESEDSSDATHALSSSGSLHRPQAGMSLDSILMPQVGPPTAVASSEEGSANQPREGSTSSHSNPSGAPSGSGTNSDIEGAVPERPIPERPQQDAKCTLSPSEVEALVNGPLDTLLQRYGATIAIEGTSGKLLSTDQATQASLLIWLILLIVIIAAESGREFGASIGILAVDAIIVFLWGLGLWKHWIPSKNVVSISNTAQASQWLFFRHPAFETVFTLIVFGLPVAAVALVERGVLAGSQVWVQVTLTWMLTFHLSHVYWVISGVIAVLIMIGAQLSDFRQRDNRIFLPTLIPGVLVAIFAVWRAFDLHSRNATHLRNLAVSRLMFEVAQDRLNLQRGLLHMLVPAAMVNVFVEKMSGDRVSAVVESGDVAVAQIRLENFRGILAPRIASPESAIVVIETFYNCIERAIASATVSATAARYRRTRKSPLIEKVHTFGDQVLIAGPLYELPSLELTDASRPIHQSASPQTHAVKNSSQPAKSSKKPPRRHVLEDNLLGAAVALLDFAKTLSEFLGQGSTSIVLHSESAFSSVLGQSRPTFNLIGPVSRTSDSLLDAIPKGMHCATSQFLRVLDNGKIALPRMANDIIVCQPAQRFRLRGAGIVYVNRIEHVGAPEVLSSPMRKLQLAPSNPIETPLSPLPPAMNVLGRGSSSATLTLEE